MRWIFLFVGIISIQSISAQRTTDSLRASYVREFPDHFFVWPVLKHRSLNFGISVKDNDRESVAFKPNNNSSAGFGFYLFEVVVEITFALPITDKQKRIFGESEARDLQINLLTKSWGMDLYHQKYSGFYRDDLRVKGPIDGPARPDIETRNFGISGFYVFNHRKFSIQSSYNYAERQLKNKGSFLVYGAINSFKTEADSALLTESTRAGLGEGADFEDLRCTTLSIAPGYSYNLIFNKVFINGTVTAGPAHHWVYYRKEDGEERYDISFNATYSLRLAAGYSTDRWFGGIGFVLQTRAVSFEDVLFENTSTTAKALVGYRFREKGILKKRLWDFIPFLNRS